MFYFDEILFAVSRFLELIKRRLVNNAFPLCSCMFSFTSPRIILTRFHVYDSLSVTSFCLSKLWIFELCFIHTTKVFWVSPLFDILENAISACRGMRDNMESYPLCEYVMQSLFLKLTGAQEQKLKCICWDIATHNYEYRYDFLNKKTMVNILIGNVKMVFITICLML